MTSINDVLDFWFAPESRPDQSHPDGRDLDAWFVADPAFDDAIRRTRGLLDKTDAEYLGMWSLKRSGQEMFSLPRELVVGQPLEQSPRGRHLVVELAEQRILDRHAVAPERYLTW